MPRIYCVEGYIYNKEENKTFSSAHNGSENQVYFVKFWNRRHSKTFFFYFSEKTSLGISSESSAKQTIHTKCQDLFSLKNIKKYKKLSSAAVVIGALRVKGNECTFGVISLVKTKLYLPSEKGHYSKRKKLASK